MPTNSGFGMDLPEDFGTLTYYDDNGNYHEEKVESVRGDYASVYDCIVNHQPQMILMNRHYCKCICWKQGLNI